MGRLRSLPLAALALAVVLGGGGCGHPSSPPPSAATAGRPGGSAAQPDGGVDVDARLVAHDARTVVAVTLRPQRRGFHVYALELDRSETGGLGVATEVEAGRGLEAVGAATTSAPVRRLPFPALDAALPVYRDGPVTITLPVHATASGTRSVFVTYGACSESTCLRPIHRREVVVAT